MLTYRCDICGKIDDRAVSCKLPFWMNTCNDGKVIKEKTDIQVFDAEICKECAQKIADMPQTNK